MIYYLGDKNSGASDGVPSDNTEDEEWSGGSPEDPDLDVVDISTRSLDSKGGGDTPTQALTTELDRKVQLAAKLMQRNCNCANGKCDKLRVRKVGEGKYNIAGKNVFVRVSSSSYSSEVMCIHSKKKTHQKFILQTCPTSFFLLLKFHFLHIDTT